jgi:ATP-binding cassette, subfamily F, member 3
MQEIAAAHVDSPFNFRIPDAPKMSDPLINLSDASIAYDETVILKNIKLNLHPGSCVGLLGANGAGKSTLIKALMGDITLSNGERVEGEHLRIGYFAQHQMEALDLDASPLLHLQRLTPKVTEQEMRNFLGGFNFQGDKALKQVRPFSGGEKARLALAIVAWQQPNLLLMDEPTNHLDLEMRHALTLALQAYKGAMIVVSHDRHLLRNCVDEFWLVADGTLTTFDGDLTDYQALLSNSEKKADSDKPDNRIKTDAKEQRQEAAAKRALLSPIKKKIDKLEKEIKLQQTTLKTIEEQLSGSEIYQEENKEELQGILKEQGSAKRKLFDFEEQWLECQEELESFQLSV